MRGSGLLVIALVAAVATPALARQRVFRGRIVMAAGGPPFSQVRVSLGRYATASPNGSGHFSGAIPDSVKSLVLDVETGSAKWVMRYPTGAVAVPADPSFETDIFVGPSLDQTLSRAYAAETAQLMEGFKAAGVADSQVLAAIDALRRQFAERTSIAADSLKLAAKRGDERAAVYPRIAAAVQAFAIKANNVQVAFRYVLESAFASDSAFALLKRAITEYNPAFDTLKTNGDGFAKAVKTYWGSDLLSSNFQAFLDFALGDIHHVHIYSLNDVMPDISKVLRGQIGGNEGKAKKLEVTARVKATVAALAPLLEELDRRKTRVLSELQAF